VRSVLPLQPSHAHSAIAAAAAAAAVGRALMMELQDRPAVVITRAVQQQQQRLQMVQAWMRVMGQVQEVGLRWQMQRGWCLRGRWGLAGVVVQGLARLSRGT